MALVEQLISLAESHQLTGWLYVQYVSELVPFVMLIAWVFFVMEKISDSTEDPFEGAATDVPISTLARMIEIDLKQMHGFEEIPEPVSDIDSVRY